MTTKYGLCLAIGLFTFGSTHLTQASIITVNESSITSGIDDTISTSQDIGVLPGGDEFIINAWIDSNNGNDVDMYKFTLANQMSLFFDIDFANDANNPSDDDTGVDTQLAIFDINGELLSFNDDSEVFDWVSNDPGSIPNGDFDSLIGALDLSSGTYFVAVSSYDNDPVAWRDNLFSSSSMLSTSGDLINGAFGGSDYTGGIDTTTGSYQLIISESFDGAVVPVPAAIWLFGSGLIGLIGIARRKKA